MLTTIIMNHIFEDTDKGREAATAYAFSAQEEIGLEWLGSHNYTIACAVAQLRVLADPAKAAVSLIELIQEYADGDFMFSDLDMGFVGQDFISVEVIWALSRILESDHYAEDFFYDRLMEQAREIDPQEDALLLKPLK